MKTNKITESKTEYSVIGEGIEEHFDNYNRADDFYKSLSESERDKVQFFGKDWNFVDGEWQEGYVEIFANSKTIS